MRGNPQYSNLRAIRGPIMVITVGVLFAFNNFTPYSFAETWPVLIIVAGLISLIGRGSVAVVPPPAAPPYTTYQPPVPPAFPPGAPPPQQPGGYRQTPYAQPGDPRQPNRGDQL